MAFGVLRHPDNCDPRATIECFCLTGFGQGSYPPYKWAIKTIALAPYTVLNDWYVIDPTITGDVFCVWLEETTFAPDSRFEVVKTGFNSADESPWPPDTLELVVRVTDSVNGISDWRYRAVFPYPLQAYTLTIVNQTGNMPNIFQDDMQLEPRPHTATAGPE